MYSVRVSTAPPAPSSGSYWSGYDLLWGLNETPPTRRTTIDRAQVVKAAIEIADDAGLAAVTMRSVAAVLDTAPMSLYRHVPDKDALISLMVDEVIRSSADDGDWGTVEGWREQLRLIASSTWRLCRRHRWYPEASMVRPPITPSGIAGFELALSIFDKVDLDIGTKALFVGAVYSTVIASALNTTTEEHARSRARMTEEEIYAAGAPFFERLITSGDYPRVSAFITGAEHLDSEARMHAAVELILDGVATRLKALGSAISVSDTLPG
jgi:AcrR family transcriptional regulator